MERDVWIGSWRGEQACCVVAAVLLVWCLCRWRGVAVVPRALTFRVMRGDTRACSTAAAVA